LRFALVALDVVALAIACGDVTAALDAPGRAATVAAGIVVALAALGAQRLYRSRACAVPVIELGGVIRAVAIATAAAAVVGNAVGGDGRVTVARAVTGGIIGVALVAAGRAAYRSWLRAERARGRFVRPVVLIGTDEEARALEQLLADHPEAGLRIDAVVGDAVEHAALAFAAALFGGYHDAVSVSRAAGATGVIVVAGALPAGARGRTVRALAASGLHVQLSPGLAGVDVGRVRAQPVAHEPMLYVEPLRHAAWQAVAKRTCDVVVSSVALIAALPVLVAAVIAIKLDDGGPVLYRHHRVGRGGRPFQVLKLRTMVRGADRLLGDHPDANARRGGPLFKMEGDPRVTRVGRVLRATSIDELPQLVNVLRGTMSLVGPRPALAHEVAHFDDELLERLRVLPGITGLWQLEGRDKSSFDVYRRLDLFYLENWSLALDLAILLSTIPNVLARPVRVLRHQPMSAPAPVDANAVGGEGVSSL
jgi:exopolysaccharide biosynthesis polyprenyl glycosylphosphotransferase